MDFACLENEMNAAPQITYAQIKRVPQASGIYTAWLSDERGCSYVGKADNLSNRLRSHYSGQRGANQFCLYIYDTYIYKLRQPNLMTAQVNTLTAQWIRENISFRWVEVPNVELTSHEDYLRQKWQPTLNPLNSHLRVS